MIEQARYHIREFLRTRFLADLDDNESIFASGRIDSCGALELLLHLESTFALNTADPDFDVTQLDTVNEIVDMLARQGTILELSF